jgi:hypothetical protein
VCIECVQTWGSSYEESNSGDIGIPLSDIFGYDGEDIGDLLLEKIGGILKARSS